MLSFKDVSKIYIGRTGEVHALDHLNLEIGEGEFVSVTGHSGSGKSTLLSLAGGLAVPTSGSVVIDNFEMSSASSAQRARFRAENLGFVFQMFHLLPYLSILDNILVAATHRTAETQQRAEMMIDQFGLSDRKSHKPGELSAGERQRVALARALVNDPKLLLADEPTGNLDKINTDAVLDFLTSYNEAGGTILLVTHDPQAAKRAGRIIEMQKGRVVEPATTPDEAVAIE